MQDCKSPLQNTLLEEQYNVINWRLDSRDLKTHGVAVPEELSESSSVSPSLSLKKFTVC